MLTPKYRLEKERKKCKKKDIQKLSQLMTKDAKAKKDASSF